VKLYEARHLVEMRVSRDNQTASKAVSEIFDNFEAVHCDATIGAMRSGSR